MKHWMHLRGARTWPNLALVASSTVALQAILCTTPPLFALFPTSATAYAVFAALLLVVMTLWLGIRTLRTRRAPPCDPVCLVYATGTTFPRRLAIPVAVMYGSRVAKITLPAAHVLLVHVMGWGILLAVAAFLLHRQRLQFTERGITVRDLAGRQRAISWDDARPSWFCRGCPLLLILRDRSDGYTVPLLILGPPMPVRVLLPSLQRYVDDPVARLELIAPATRRRTATPPPPHQAHAD